MTELLSAGMLVCETAISEQNGLASAIRIGDVFFRLKLSPNPEEPYFFEMHIVAWARFRPGTEKAYAMRAEFIKPNGTRKLMFEDPLVKIQNRIEGAMPTVKFITDRIRVQADQVGIHRCELLFNGHTVASTHFSVLDPPNSTKAG